MERILSFVAQRFLTDYPPPSIILIPYSSLLRTVLVSTKQQRSSEKIARLLNEKSFLSLPDNSSPHIFSNSPFSVFFTIQRISTTFSSVNEDRSLSVILLSSEIQL